MPKGKVVLTKAEITRAESFPTPPALTRGIDRKSPFPIPPGFGVDRRADKNKRIGK